MWNQTENTYGHKLRVAVNGLRTAFLFMAKFYLICLGGSLLQVQKYNWNYNILPKLYNFQSYNILSSQKEQNMGLFFNIMVGWYRLSKMKSRIDSIYSNLINLGTAPT